MAGSVFVAFGQFRSSESFREAERFVLASPEIERLVGAGAVAERPSQANISRDAGGRGEASFSLQVHGEGGRTDVAVELALDGQAWQVTSAHYRGEDGRWYELGAPELLPPAP